ncbi:MAG TPA: carboxy terminal-processing peptidase, partial [Verrucomicrobiae bacterium]|nr:carboxy terminal-processing peptidase [Verrucomicrobiae bacterium]
HHDGKHVRLGVIDLPSFYASVNLGENHGTPTQKSTSADVALLLKKFEEEKVNGVILDLRHNGGGSLEEAIKLTGLFIKQGPVVQVRSPDNDVFVDSDQDPSVTYDGPLIVLTSRFSASASEIVAGALQDYGRALIVGDISTHGKGTVQNMNSLRPFMHWRGEYFTNDPGALKLTIRKFYRPSGSSTQLKGVTPDIVLPSVWNYAKDVGESSLDNPLPWDTIKPADFDPVNRVKPYLAQLRKWSDERVATNEDFVYMRQDIAKFRKQQAANEVSLNEKVRLKELNDDLAQQKARDKERLARKEPDEKIYDISLKAARQPGLPTPLQLGENDTNHLAGAASVTPAVGTNIASAASAKTSATLDKDDSDSDSKSPP